MTDSLDGPEVRDVADVADVRSEALGWLRTLTDDPSAAFREGQLEAIVSAVEDRSRQLVVQRTGWGKSAVYFIATRLLRERGAGPTILISPLLALMRNQIEAAERMQLRAVTINSGNVDEWDEIRAELEADAIDLLLISAPRLANAGFVEDVLPTVAKGSGLLVVDEAHCISDWGHDFVPDYRRVVRVLDRLPRGVPVLCCTATANDRVVADVQHQLGEDLITRRGPLARSSLELHVIDLPQPPERLAWLRRHLAELPGTGIVYCLTVADAERIAACLAADGHDVAAYSGRSEVDVRVDLERRLLDNEIKALVATSALGMGFDKPDLGFVVHFQAPGTPIAYYQQVGRAGRSLDRAVGVLLRGREDADIQDWFITTAFPDAADAEAVVAHLAESERPVGLGTIETIVNVRRSRLDLMLKVLEVEGAVEKVKGGYRRTPEPWSYDRDRVERVTAARREEQRQMLAYAETEGCRMQFLADRLDDPAAAPCGRCDRCDPAGSAAFLVPLEPAEVARARACLRNNEQIIEARRAWPAGLGEPKGRIPAERQCQVGVALSHLGDGGWGDVVRDHRRAGEPFADDVVAAAAELLGRWRFTEPPAWVTCVPSPGSPGRPDPVRDLAVRLAEAMHLPFEPVVVRQDGSTGRTTMENSAQQVRELWRAFAVETPVPAGPVLLVDAVVDSRWTFTIVADLLVRAGCPAVTPFALAKASAT